MMITMMLMSLLPTKEKTVREGVCLFANTVIVL